MKQLAEYGPLAIFFAAFFLSGKDIYFATIALMISYSIGMLVLYKLEGKLSRMHQIMWLVIMLFGGLTVFFKNELFIKWKPTIANWAIGTAFLGSHFIGKQPLIKTMMSSTVALEEKKWITLSWLWIVFFIVCGVLNILVAYNFSTEAWVKFKVFGLFGLTILFSILQGIWLFKNGEFKEDTAPQVKPHDDESLDNHKNKIPMQQTRLTTIKEALQKKFPDAYMTLKDESHLHAGHVGAEDGRGHFRLHIFSDVFIDKTRLQSHQLIYAALGDLMQTDIHALAITAESKESMF